MKLRPVFLKVLSLVCVLMMLFAAWLPQASAQDSSMIRVYLRRLGITESMKIQINGSYMLEGGEMTFSDGAELEIALRNGELVLHSKGIAIAMGKRISLLRCQGETSAFLRINDTSGMYEGDLMLDISEDAIRPILHIHVEDYLLGVVPFEMGDGFPLEALKAQAIAARTYALHKQNQDRAYDVEDTTNDQAYKGRTTNSPLSEQAVFETAGLVGTYRGKLAQCYYSASNGGQTELGQHMWPLDNPDAYGYMNMQDDPYDLENDASSVKRYTINKKPGKDGVGTALHNELISALAPQLEAQGLPQYGDQIRIDEVLAVTLSAPKFEAPSKLMTQIHFELKISARECLFRAPEGSVSISEDGLSDPNVTPAPTATPAYAPYTKLDHVFSVDLPIFPNAEKAMGLSINVYQNELMTVLDIGSAFMIESRRFGHGVGMSQRGAQQMASKYYMTYDQILAFYYPGLEVVRIDAPKQPLPTIDMSLMATPAPTPSPTPRPTLMPVNESELPRGAYIAVVTNIDEDSSLNLREGPSLSSEILRRLYKNQKLIVLSTDKAGWSHVRTDVIEGYVKHEYLQTAEN